jgi:hypothetical protein
MLKARRATRRKIDSGAEKKLTRIGTFPVYSTAWVIILVMVREKPR